MFSECFWSFRCAGSKSHIRHTAASLFAGSGMPLARVARIFGHADTATTYKVYLGFFPDDFVADMDRLDP